MTTAWRILALLLLASAWACAQMTVISGSPSDPEVKPEQLTATIVHFQQTRTSARRTIHILVMALQRTSGSRAVALNQAIDNEQDIVDSANWCIVAMRDRVPGAEACMLPRAEAIDQGLKGVCELARNPSVNSHCSQRASLAKSFRND